MGRELFEKRKIEFKKYILENKQIPKRWEVRFSDGDDLRLWFDSICKMSSAKEYVDEIKLILNQLDLKLLNDEEKEIEFLNCINNINRIPLPGEIYFSDNHDMYTWYMNYKFNNRNFETMVHNSLSEYKDLDLAVLWPRIKEEFISIIKMLKRIPEHGEVIIQDDIDVRVIYDKLESFEPELAEKILLHLQTYNKNTLSADDRVSELLSCVSNLGYIPFLQESRFSDGTDMFTWYMRYKNILQNLESEVQSRVKVDNPNKKVNVYLIPNFKSKGGNFYTICTNVGERLDLSNISSYEEAQKLDETLTKRGGVILKKDEEIESVNFTKGKSK